MHRFPHEYMELDINEQAFILASIQIKKEADRKRERASRSKAKR